MRRNVYTLTDKHTFTANTTTTVDLPENTYITQIDCQIKLNVTPGSSVSTKEDHFGRIIDACSIKASRARTFFDVSDGRQWQWWNYMVYEGQLALDALPAAGGSATDIYGMFRIHLGFDPTDPFDPSVVIPGPHVSNLEHRITWGSASDLGTGFTINSGEMTLTVYELSLEPGETEASIWTQGLVDPRVEARTIDIDAVYSNLSLTDDVPVGDILYQSLVMVVDSSDNRSDSEVSAVGVKLPKGRETPWDIDWYPLKSKTRSQFRIPSTVTGVTMIPWEE